MFRAVLGLSFFSVTVLAALVMPTVTVPKARLVGVAVSGANPVPVRFSRSGEPMALYPIVKSPVIAPSTEGLKATVTMQCPLPANVPGQVFAVMLKSPNAVIDVMGTDDELMLVMVTFFPALVVPNSSLPNARVAADRLKTGLIGAVEMNRVAARVRHRKRTAVGAIPPTVKCVVGSGKAASPSVGRRER